MAFVRLRREEQVGLALAVALHAALLGVLAMRPKVTPPPMPERISVTLSDETGLTETAPSHADAAADQAPTLGTTKAEAPTPPIASPAPPKVEPLPIEPPLPEPKAVAVTRPKPEAVTREKPQPAVRPEPQPVAPPQRETPVRRPAKPAKPSNKTPEDTIGQAIAAAKPVHKHVPSVKDWSLGEPTVADHQPAGASRIGNDFLKGVAGGKASGKAQQQGAAVIGPEVKAALSGAITRQLKPHWVVPEGADADKLVTVLTWDLNPDGSLAGTPHVLRQEGITASNRPQAARHAEQAIRAVMLAAPFQLPAQYYAVWKHVRSFEFNRTLSQ